ncbi:hypothetical protein M0Q97_01470 [Candidatus Dojkabacteria bacterium]|jgi:hypothetical protein|nr:hypothetical protein [Candidatus Dojkabacteria bacterium]
MRKYIDTFNERMLNESYQKGDLIRINFDLEQDPDDGEYGYSVEKGEIGEIRYLINKDETRETEKIYSVKFPNKDGKLRMYGTLINEPFYSKV